MSPISVLPGRIRLELSTLIGKEQRCRCVEMTLRSWEGVRCAEANPRTGRLLIQFDAGRLDRETLLERVGRLDLRCIENTELRAKAEPTRREPSPLHRHVLRELLTHAILPAPLDLILPSALESLKKKAAV